MGGAFGYAVGWNPFASDYSRYLSPNISRRAVGLWSGLGVLVSTHLLDVAERLCDRVIILDHGRRLAEGSLATLRGESDATLEDVFLALTRHSEPAADASEPPR